MLKNVRVNLEPKNEGSKGQGGGARRVPNNVISKGLNSQARSRVRYVRLPETRWKFPNGKHIHQAKVKQPVTAHMTTQNKKHVREESNRTGSQKDGKMGGREKKRKRRTSRKGRRSLPMGRQRGHCFTKMQKLTGRKYDQVRHERKYVNQNVK